MYFDFYTVLLPSIIPMRVEI